MPRENPRIKKPRAAMIQELEMRRIKMNPSLAEGQTDHKTIMPYFCGGRTSRIKKAEIIRATVKRANEVK